MEKEVGFFPDKKHPITNAEDFIALLMREVPSYTRNMLDELQGNDKTTLSEFLKNKTEGSEWTDPLGFKVRIEKGVYILLEE